ncbi:thioesterase II family protein [Rhizobium laguerreae]|uniref:thioesterase II family protein n=1 Tax=Rhizobium laguerreae TaxID=1076926 RepID=UPI0035E4304C
MLPHAGGLASSFGEWVPHLVPRVVPRPLDVPGRSRFYTAPPVAMSIPAMALLVAEVIRPSLIAETEFGLLGYSMGALIAYEVALKLKSDGFHAVCLVACACDPPDAERASIHCLDDNAFDVALAEIGGMPAEIAHDRELMDLFRPTLRRDIQATETYCADPVQALDCPIHVLGGVDDKETSIKELEGWQRFTSAHCTLKMFQNGHFFARGNERLVARYILSRLQLDRPMG